MRSWSLVARRVTRTWALVLLVLLVLLARPAHAEGAAVHGDACVGYASSGSRGDGLIVGLDALARWRILEAGVLAESSAAGQETIAVLGIMAGIGYYRWKAVGFDVLGVFGGHVYDHVSPEIGSPGAGGSVPFLQARVGVSFLPLKPFTFGAWGFYGDDVTRVAKNYSVTNNAPGGTTLTRPATIGEASYGAMLRLGFDVGL